MFGRLGSAALQPVYVRGRDASGRANTALNGRLRDSLQTLLALLRNLHPRRVPFAHRGLPTATMYADAFFQLGDEIHSLSDEPPRHWQPDRACKCLNGWGFVTRTPNGIFFGYGSVPTALLRLLSSRRAYIYALEIFAQVIAAVTCCRYLPQYWVSSCDNVAGKSALSLGYGRDRAINNMIAFFWAVANALQWSPHFEWVPSDLNISDPFSRQNISIGVERGWKQDTDLSALREIFASVATNLEWATSAAVSAALSLSWCFK